MRATAAAAKPLCCVVFENTGAIGRNCSRCLISFSGLSSCRRMAQREWTDSPVSYQGRSRYLPLTQPRIRPCCSTCLLPPGSSHRRVSYRSTASSESGLERQSRADVPFDLGVAGEVVAGRRSSSQLSNRSRYDRWDKHIGEEAGLPPFRVPVTVQAASSCDNQWQTLAQLSSWQRWKVSKIRSLTIPAKFRNLHHRRQTVGRTPTTPRSYRSVRTCSGARRKSIGPPPQLSDAPSGERGERHQLARIRPARTEVLGEGRIR